MSAAKDLAKLYLDIGIWSYQELLAPELAEKGLSLALLVNPEAREAWHYLGLLYEKSGNWFLALRAIEAEAALLQAEEPLLALAYRAAKISWCMLLDRERARKIYQQLHKLGDSYFRRQAYARVVQLYTPLLAALEELGPAADCLLGAEKMAICYALGVVALSQGDLAEAEAKFMLVRQRLGLQAILGLSADLRVAYQDSLQNLADLALKAGDFTAALKYLEELADSLGKEEKQGALAREIVVYQQISSLKVEQFKDLPGAISALNYLRQLQALSAEGLSSLAEYYLALELPLKALEAAEEALVKAESPTLQMRIYRLLAQIYAEKLRAPLLAVLAYNEILDRDPLALGAFTALEGLLTPLKAWDLLTYNYLAMLKRMQARAQDFAWKERELVWQGLAALYQCGLQDQEKADQVYALLQSRQRRTREEDANFL